ncbi:MAG: hypothetical protein E6J90_00475 [Deltaproteobacteria bacterium]|nr:MAG: hypothetical protein E6J90_00475 [Deltaproteobacteria bacterium]HXG96295.1 hypothetical protein [Gemmatimonadales bacterium]
MNWNDADGTAHRNDEIGHNLPAARAAVDAQLRDADAMAALYRIAERYARVRRDSWVAHELVWDVLGDLLLGDLPYDPERPFAPQLQREVRRRANRFRRTQRPQRDATQPMLIALDKAPPSALVLDSRHEALESDDQPLDPGELVSRIREQARGDEPAQQLLALYDRGHTSRRAVLSTGMTEWVYRAARKRLVGYAAVAAAATATPTPPDAEGAPDAATLPITWAIGIAGRTVRVRRAVSRALHRRKSRSA